MLETEMYRPEIQQSVEAEEPLSFDLSFEKKRIERARFQGKESAWRTYNGLLNNMEFWSREYIAQIPTVHYLWNIEKQKDGSIKLNNPAFGYADDISWNAAYGEEVRNLPQYEKERRAVEHTITGEMYKKLQNADVGTTYIWTSPPPEGVANENYGGYTMTHVYEVDEMENGGKVLKGHDILHHADNKEQKKVLEQFSKNSFELSSNPSSIELLGTLVEARAGITFSEIEEKFKEGDNHNQNDEEKRLGQFNKILEKHRLKIKAIYQHLYAGNDSLALILFRDWVTNIEEEWQELRQRENRKYAEGSIRSEVNGEFVFTENYDDLPPVLGMRNISSSTSAQVVMQRGGSCGKGFGMSGLNADGNRGGTVAMQQEVFGYAPALMAGSLAGSRVVEQSSNDDDEDHLKKLYGEDDLGPRAFRCPACQKINVRPRNETIPECQKCGSNKVAC